MKRFFLIALTVAFVATSTLTLRAQDGEGGAKPYEIDAVHSAVVFKVQHLGAGYTHGRFNAMQGMVNFDANDRAASSVEVTVMTASVDTNSDGRDDHLRSADFFNAREFPTLTFKSTGIEHVDGDNYKMTGELTAMGQTKTITADLVFVGEATNRGTGKHLIGAEATFNVNRLDFGIGKPGGLGEEVPVTVSIEAISK